MYSEFDFFVAVPDLDRLLAVPLDIAVQHVTEHADGQVGDMRHPAQHAARHVLAVERDHALADVLCEIANAFEIVGDPKHADDLAQVHGHGLARRDGGDGLALDFALPRIYIGIGIDHPLAAGAIALDQRIDGLDDLPFRQSAHLRDHAGELLEIGVKSLDRVFGRRNRHCHDFLATTGPVATSER